MSNRKLEVENLLILKTVDGSHCYGTNTENSDIDICGIYIDPDDGLFQKPDEYRESSPDLVYYNLKKIILLLQESNPNVSNLLFCRDEDVLYCNEKGRLLRENRMLFVSANAKHRYSGYAHSQLTRMRNHNKWIVNPQPEAPPNIKDYATFIDVKTGKLEKYSDDKFENFPVKYNAHVYLIYGDCENPKIRSGIFPSHHQVSEHDNSIMHNLKFVMIVDRQNFEKSLDDHKNYWNWKKNRNVVRSELEEKFGYDTKHASHAIRLMRMGLEILKFGVVNVYRYEDKEELLAIRNGAWSYEKILEEAEKLEHEASEIYKNKTYKVPYAPDKVKINELYKELIKV